MKPEFYFQKKGLDNYFQQNKQSYFDKIKKPIERTIGFYDVLEWRIKRERSNIIIIVGEQGAGKSNTGTVLAKEGNRRFYHKKFDIDKHLFHSILEFTKSMPDLRNSFVMLEECGVELNSKDWRDAQNRVFRDIVETFRIYKINLVMTLPNLNDLDKSSRYLSHFIIRMNFPGNAIIFRKFSSFLTDKQKFMPVWKWEDIPDMKKMDKKLWEKYEAWHEKYMKNKRYDWLDEMETRTMKKNYQKQWYKQRTSGFEVQVL